MTFKLKKHKSKRLPIDQRSAAGDKEKPVAEVLTGYIQGKPAASQAEERLANALSKDPRVSAFEYSMENLVAPKGMPGWKQLDFLVQWEGGRYQAISMEDETFVHHGPSAALVDSMDNMEFVYALNKLGVAIDGVTRLDAALYDTQESADAQEKQL
jgi:hypothetical protein